MIGKSEDSRGLASLRLELEPLRRDEPREEISGIVIVDLSSFPLLRDCVEIVTYDIVSLIQLYRCHDLLCRLLDRNA